MEADRPWFVALVPNNPNGWLQVDECVNPPGRQRCAREPRGGRVVSARLLGRVPVPGVAG